MFMMFLMMKSKISFLRFLILVIFLSSFMPNSSAENVKKSVDENRDDNGESIDESKDESLEIPVESEPTNITCTRRQNSQMHELRTAKYKQFPFMVAIMSRQNEYLCSGTVVSNGIILTTAHCTEQPISYVLLNSTKDKRDETTVSLHIIKSEKFPTFTGGDSSKDVGLIYIEKHNNTVASKIRLSNFTNSKNIVDLEALGYGLNADVGQTKELQYIGLENRYLEIGDAIQAFFDCVDTKIPTCFKDTGGPVIYDNELIGIVTKGQEECSKEMTSTYAVNKKLAEILPTYTFKAWLDEKIKKNEVMEHASLVTYPLKPVARKSLHKMTQMAQVGNQCAVPAVFIVAILCFILQLF